MRTTTAICVFLVVASTAQVRAQNPAFSAEAMATTEIRSEAIGANLYVLFGVGGNIVPRSAARAC